MNNDDNISNFFGFERIDPALKASKVGQIFSSVASRYDIMNDLMSAGIHRLWKKHLIKKLSLRPGDTLLDMAGGTGDVAISAHKAYPYAKIIAADINPEMLSTGRNRAIDQGILSEIEWVLCDAQSLSFPDNSVDCYTIAFGLRNVTYIDQALKEAFRVLKPGGCFYCLEFSHLTVDWLQKLYDTYSFNIVPWIGEIVAKDRASYQYLVESIRRFPKQEDLKSQLEETGFWNVTYENMTQGVVALHQGWKPT